MTDPDNLNQQQFGRVLYHGTWAGWLRKGQNLLPGGGMGMSNFGISSPEHVYLTTDPEKAKWYAEQTYKELVRSGLKMGNVPVIGASPTVYTVHPSADVEEDPNSDTPGVHWRAKKAKITGRYE